MKRLILMLLVMVAFAATADAQGFLKKLKERAVNAAENAVTNKVDKETNKAVGDVLDGKSKTDNSGDAADATDTYDPQAGAAKSDFVRGSAVMFEDNMQGEQVGEFPSKWDLVRGNAEIATIQGKTCIAFLADDSWISPLVKGGIKNYLGDVFTVEYDMLYKQKGGADPDVELDIMHESMERDHELFTIQHHFHYDRTGVSCDYVRPTEQSWDHKEGNSRADEVACVNDGRWHHYALSFNKRAIKFYIDGKRVINVPNAKAGAGWIT